VKLLLKLRKPSVLGAVPVLTKVLQIRQSLQPYQSSLVQLLKISQNHHGNPTFLQKIKEPTLLLVAQVKVLVQGIFSMFMSAVVWLPILKQAQKQNSQVKKLEK
jgi:hypothetical protein